MWHDNQTETDLLGFQRFVHAVVELAQNERLQPLTIGVHGTWGSGKSSVMAMAHAALSGKDKIATIWISGWAFEDFEHTKSALMDSILKALDENQSLFGDCKGQIRKLKKKVSLLRAGALVAKSGIAIGSAILASHTQGQTPIVSLPTIEDVAGIFTTEDSQGDVASISDFRKQFSELLEQAKIQSLVIFIDDLDRCMPRTIIESFEAIRLFLAVPRTVFVIGASEEIIQGAINTQYPESDYGRAFGRQYLEKIVQVPLHLPPLNPPETLTYLNLLFAEQALSPNQFEALVATVLDKQKGERYRAAIEYRDVWDSLPEGQRTSDLKEGLDIANRIASSLHDGTTGNPREIKRFLNMLELRREIGTAVGLGLDLAVMAKLMLLEYYQNRFFRRLFEWHLASGGAVPHLHYLEGRIGQAEALQGESTTDDVEDDLSYRAEHATTDAREVGYAQHIVNSCREWLEDSRVKAWLALPPPFSGQDLSAYFYLAREGLDVRGSGKQQLSAAAKALLQDYVDGGPLAQRRAEDRLRELGESDRDAVYEQLFASYRTQPSEKRWREALISVAKTRPETLPRLMDDLRGLPSTSFRNADVVAFTNLGQIHPQHASAVLAWISGLDKSRPGIASVIDRAVKQLSK